MRATDSEREGAPGGGGDRFPPPLVEAQPSDYSRGYDER